MVVARSPQARPSSRWRPAAVLAALGFLLSALPAQANHDQEGVTFDSIGGNEWWVDVQLGGHYAFYGNPEVRDTDGGWVTMDHPSWAAPGRYTLSYHVEPGHQVKFRLSYRESVIVSCWFTHPAGVENCDGSEVFAATFKPGGNADLIQATVTGNQPLSYVTWSVDGTYAANGMTRQPGGTEKTSTWVNQGGPHVPDGTLITFSAGSTDDWNSGVQSGCFRWPALTPVACPIHPYVSAGYPRSYDGDVHHMEAYGYYWYSEAPNAPTLDHMEVRFDGGTFNAMTPVPTQDGSTPYYHRYDNAPDRSLTFTQFRAVDTAGGTACEDTGFIWPQDGNVPATVNTFDQIIFTNDKGTTSYVQTNVYASKHIAAVEAQVNGGPWVPMKQQPWCDWAATMSAPTGTVVFRGYFDDLTRWTSDSRSWNPQGGSSFGAAFYQVGGSEWWQQVQVNSFGGALAGVQARVDGGAWKSLAAQSWGNQMWAGSSHAVQGSAVQFQALGPSGAKVLSACYRWIPPSGQQAQIVDCPTAPPPPPPPPPPGFDATFTGVKGNDWWVQASVSATGGTLAGVDARVNCAGAWHPLAKQSYGWSASFNVPAGSKVDFRARSTAGGTDLSGGYVWPNATPTSAC
ncbi:MAG: hypothetical protein QOJ26_1156 [Thermoplasmata archaeon]|nr:hypothetical protein [Thermoplasmata archaeon]